jgi:hypothetical protein
MFDHMHLQWFAEGDDKSYEEMSAEELIEVVRQRDESLKERDEVIERTKKAQAGSDREVQKKENQIKEMQQKIEELENNHMSEEERRQKEFESMKQEREKLEKQLQEKNLKDMKQNLLKEAGLPDRFTDRIVGQNEEEIKADIEEFKKVYTEEVGAGLEQEIQNRFGGKQPPKSAQKSGDLSYSDLLNMSEEQQAQLSAQQIQEIIERG